MADQSTEQPGISRSTAEANQVLPDWLKYDSDTEYKTSVDKMMRNQETARLNNDLGTNAPDWLRYDPNEEAVTAAVEAKVATYKAQAVNLKRLVEKVRSIPTGEAKQ